MLWYLLRAVNSGYGFSLLKNYLLMSVPIQLTLLLLLAFLDAVRTLDCQPFGVRTFFGLAYTSPRIPTPAEQLRIKFNTVDQCNASFIHLSQKGNVNNVFCDSDKLSVTNTTTFTTYVHSCSVAGFAYGMDIDYWVYGSSTESDLVISHLGKVSIMLPNPQISAKMSVITFGDWSSGAEQLGLISIEECLASLVSKNRTDIQGIIFNGDMAYNLETNECQNYVQFLKMLEIVSPSWPLMLTTGNHEWKSSSNYLLYSKSFELYNLSSSLVQSYYFKDWTFTSIDFYRQMYKISSNTEDEQFYSHLDQEFQALKKVNKPWRIGGSHYPLFCSVTYDKKDCITNINDFSQLFSRLNDNEFSVFFSAHVHTYEREYPYYKGTVTPVQGPYTNIAGLIPIIQGAAGNRQNFDSQPYDILEWTAKVSYNRTGFGILSIQNQSAMSFSHYTTKVDGGYELYDSVWSYKSRREILE